jgi:hypothetical protein
LIYLHVLDPSRPIKLPEALLSLEARLLGGMKPLKEVQLDHKVSPIIPPDDRDPFDTVIVLTPTILDREQEARRR